MRLRTVYGNVVEAAKQLSEESGLRIEIGYIGNIDEMYDDRLWYAWVMNARNSRNSAIVHIGRFSTARLSEMKDVLNVQSLANALSGDVYAAPILGWDGTPRVTADESRQLIANFMEGHR